jgi:CubicO group peptidase (beta-lactamase class C family)
MNVDGFTAPGFERVRETFAAHFAAGEELGAGFAAVREGEVLVNLWGGFADRAQTRPWTHDTIAPVYSTTKPIAALIAARLVGQSLLNYDRPVSDDWPEFAVHGKGALTLGQMLSHQAGLPGFVEEIDPSLWLDPPALAARLAATAPMWPPGTAHGYHPLTWGYLVGELVARVRGKTLGAILAEEITGPLAINFRIGTPASEHGRTADIQRPKLMPSLGEPNAYRRVAFLTKWAAPDRGGPIWREIEIPSANGHGTALGVARLYSAFAHGGKIEGHEVVAPAAFAAMTRSWAAGPDLVLPFEVDFGAGVMRNTQRVYGPNPSAFGHSGWGGSMGLGDPETGVAAAYVMNRQSNHLQGDPRAQALIAALYACL